MKFMLGGVAAIIALLSVAIPATGCGTDTPMSSPSTVVLQSAGPSDADIAADVRSSIEENPPTWLPYLADVTFHGRTLEVALQVDRSTDREFAEQIGRAIRTNVRLGSHAADIDWIEVTDGAGNGITQLMVASN